MTDLTVLRPDERPWGAILHLTSAIPIWGFVISMLFWLYYKNRSREMIFHIKQAVSFHKVILIVLVIGIFVQIFCNILDQLSPAAARVVETVNWWLCITAWTACAFSAVMGAALVHSGRGFLHPIVGQRVLEATAQKFTEE